MDLPWAIMPNQHVTVYEEMKGCVNKGRLVDNEYPDFRKAFDTLSPSILRAQYDEIWAG